MSNLDFVAAQTSAALRRVYQKAVSPLSMERTGFAPIPGDFDNYVPGAKQMVLRASEDVNPEDQAYAGEATIRARVGTADSDETVNVRTFVGDAHFELDLVRQSQMLGQSLGDREIASAIRYCRRMHDTMAWAGGFGASDSFARSTNVGQESNLATQWTALTTGATLYDAMATFANTIATNSRGNYRCNRMAVTLGVYNKAITLFVGDGGGVTVAQALRNNMDVELVPIYDLANRADSGQTGRAIAYSTDSEIGRNLLLMPENVHQPLDYRLYFEVPVEAKSAGFYWMNTTAARYQDNTG